MTVNLSMFAGVGAQLFDNNGTPLSGGKLFTYTAGTTTPRATYTTSAGNVAHTNPIILDSAGRVSTGGEIWLTGGVSYKFVLRDSNDVLIATYDNVTGAADVAANQVRLTPYQWITATDVQGGFEDVVDVLGSTVGSSEIGFIQGGTGAVASTVQTQLRAVVTPEQFGALGDGTTNDTAAFTAAMNYLSTQFGGGDLILGKKNYRIREWVIDKIRINVIGQGEATRLTFFPSGDDATDSTAYTVRWTAALGSLQEFCITGRNLANPYPASFVGNGLLVVPSGGALFRTITNLQVLSFAGYNASAVYGGTYGLNGTFSRADVTNDLGGFLLTGGNGIVLNPNNTFGSELSIDGLIVKNLDGFGVDFGSTNDSKITRMVIANCMNRGFKMEGSNTEFDMVKVYLCNRLNVRDDVATTVTTMIPQQSTISYDLGAVILAGSKIYGRIEAQENASIGFYLGFNAQPLQESNLMLIADGNGGVDTTQTAPVQAAYRRPGVMFGNYWANTINLTADDFRAWAGYPRQSQAFQMLGTTYVSTLLGQLQGGAFYKIANNSGGADFTPLQIGLATTSNAVGFVFQARRQYPNGLSPSTNFGTGSLTSPNGNSIITASIVNQYNQDNNINNGYDYTFDSGTSVFTINGRVLKNGNGAWNGNLTALGAYNLWVDATGDLRIKSGTPTSDTDGTVVGTQT
jgi:hypothetical protein